MASRWEAANHENEDAEDEESETENKTWPARSGSRYGRSARQRVFARIQEGISAYRRVHRLVLFRLSFNKTVVTRYRIHLEDRRLAPGTINGRLAAVRRLAYEAADSGLSSPELAAGIPALKEQGSWVFGLGIG
jgi:hypothetical protein